MSRKIKSVSFSLDDPFEKEMYEHLQQYPNFSTYIKRLIQNNMNKSNPPTIKPYEQPQTKPFHKPNMNANLMKSVL